MARSFCFMLADPISDGQTSGRGSCTLDLNHVYRIFYTDKKEYEITWKEISKTTRLQWEKLNCMGLMKWSSRRNSFIHNREYKGQTPRGIKQLSRVIYSWIIWWNMAWSVVKARTKNKKENSGIYEIRCKRKLKRKTRTKILIKHGRCP